MIGSDQPVSASPAATWRFGYTRLGLWLQGAYIGPRRLQLSLSTIPHHCMHISRLDISLRLFQGFISCHTRSRCFVMPILTPNGPLGPQVARTWKHLSSLLLGIFAYYLLRAYANTKLVIRMICIACSSVPVLFRFLHKN